MGIAIGPAEGRTRWLNPSYALRKIFSFRDRRKPSI
jgi:hypothetical protein